MSVPELHHDFGVVDGVTDDVAVKTVVLLGGQESPRNVLGKGDQRRGLHEEVHVDLGVDDVGVVVDLRDLGRDSILLKILTKILMKILMKLPVKKLK